MNRLGRVLPDRESVGRSKPDAGEQYEVTTFRIDGEYSDSRHPDSVSFTPSLREDLARRDFTMNAMAYNEVDGLIDPFGGEKSLSIQRQYGHNIACATRDMNSTHPKTSCSLP